MKSTILRPAVPFVVIEIAPPDPPPELSSALVAACSQAVQGAECVVATDERPDEQVALAVVGWEGAASRHADVRVGTRGRGDPVWRSRTLDFEDRDEPVERWRAVGLTIATLAGEVRSEVERASPPPAVRGAPSPPAAGRDEAARAPRARRRMAPGPGLRLPSVDVGALAGPGLDVGGFRWGGWLGVVFRPGAAPWFAGADFSYALRPADDRGLDATWATAALGVGAHLGRDGRGLAIEPHAGVQLDWMRASVSAGAPGPRSGERLGYGLVGGVRGLFALGPVSPLAGVEAWQRAAAHRVVLQGNSVGVAPAAGFALRVGARVVLD